MERTFFHDVLNSMASLESAISLTSDSADWAQDPIGQMIPQMARNVSEQISFHRRLSEAERNDLVVHYESFDCTSDVRDLVEWERWITQNNALGVEFDVAGDPVTLTTDRILFRRIVLNLIRNAREASDTGQSVRVRVAEKDGHAVVSVRNEAVMPKSVQLQVFQRSFSTKGPGRGIGTYSMKLLSHDYLGGDVTFTSENDKGTEFVLRLPVSPT
jgi:signal transduction histidine kinase